jgi:hypothetical protein
LRRIAVGTHLGVCVHVFQLLAGAHQHLLRMWARGGQAQRAQAEVRKNGGPLSGGSSTL